MDEILLKKIQQEELHSEKINKLYSLINSKKTNEINLQEELKFVTARLETLLELLDEIAAIRNGYFRTYLILIGCLIWAFVLGVIANSFLAFLLIFLILIMMKNRFPILIFHIAVRQELYLLLCKALVIKDNLEKY